MLNNLLKVTLIATLSLSWISGCAQTPNGERPERAERPERDRERGGGRLGGYTEVTNAGKVPDHLFNIILGRPTNESMIASVVSYENMQAYIEYGDSKTEYKLKTNTEDLQAEQPFEFEMNRLQKDTRYYYQLRYKQADQEAFKTSELYSFHTPRSFESDFIFTVQADSHLDENTSGEVYINTLNGALDASPDFHLALGDTFMTDKYVEYPQSEPHYHAQRYYLGSHLTHSSALFFALGNHDAESGVNDRTDWSTTTRNKYFPNPSPNEFYSGNLESDNDDAPIRNYYAFEWGNSLFMALDPFRYSNKRNRDRGAGNWYMTLGKTQYDWMVKTLSESDATFKFVYLHNLVGGAASNRGGAEASVNYEWGGHEENNGSYTFDKMRPGWGKPIHDVLVENEVSIVFHGHDHMYIRQERDGLIYQLVQQPGHPSGNVNSARAYGYLSGDVIAGAGHLRVFVSDDQLKVDFIDGRVKTNGELRHSYVLDAKK